MPGCPSTLLVGVGVQLGSSEGVVGGILGRITESPVSWNREVGDDLAESGGVDWGILTTRR